MSGGAQFGDARIRGTLVVGPSGADTDAGQSFIASGNYVQNTTGWKMSSSGDLEANSGRIRGDLIVDGTLTTSKLALGVLRTNPINNPGFEEEIIFTNITDAGQGDVNQWRRNASTANNSAYRGSLKARGGNYRGSIYVTGTGGTSSVSELYSNTFLVKAGSTYTVTYSAVSNGAGAAGGTATMAVDAIFGTTQTNVVQSATTINLSEGVVTPPYFTYANIVSTGYQTYAADMVIPGGQTDLWCSLRFRNTGNAADTMFYIDDIAAIETKVGGATELTAAGLRLFSDEGDEVAAFVSNRPTYITVNKDGDSVAGIDDSGNISGYSGSFTGDGTTTNWFGDVVGAMSVGGMDYADRMTSLPQGVLTQTYRSSLVSVTNIRTEYGIFEVGFTAQPGRHYRIMFAGGTVRANTGAPTVSVIARVRRTTDGSAPSITNGSVLRSMWVGLPGNNIDVSIPPIFVSGDITGGASSPTDIRLLLTINALNAGATDWVSYSNKGGTSAPSPIECVVEDLGPDPQDVYQGSSGGGTLYTGGTTTEPPSTPAAVKKTYVTTWYNNSSQTRRGVSSFGNNTVNTSAPSGYTLAGYYSSSNGNQYSYFGFTSGSGPSFTGPTIGSAIAGATITKVELYVRNATFYASSGGSQRFSMTTLSGMPSAGSPSAVIGNFYTGNVAFTTGQGKWITLPLSGVSGAAATLTGGGRIAIIGPGTSGSQSYYSKWYNGAAQLRITYTK